MQALIEALGHEVVELDRLQVQRSECTVANKWKVELCYMYADSPTERTVEKEVEVTQLRSYCNYYLYCYLYSTLR